MDLKSTRHGMLGIETDALVSTRGRRVSIALGGASQLVVNGQDLPLDDPATAARLLNGPIANSPLMTVPLLASVEEGCLCIDQPSHLFEAGAGAFLAGREAEAAFARAAEAMHSPAAWPTELDLGPSEEEDLSRLASGNGWNGPLVVSMPRTGSTLLGTMFLLVSQSTHPSGFRFDRYIHEPAAPLFWQGRGVPSLDDIITSPLTDRDVVQESAYQFAHPLVADWFVRSARQPIVFAIRHPQISWPSRWRIMLNMLLDTGSEHEGRIRRAVETDDFSDLGDLLSTVRPPDNGFYAFLTLLDSCLDAGIEYVLIDNGRFRQNPDGMLRQLCERLDITYDPSMTTWTDLNRAKGRVVMSELALDEEYPWYYAGTLESRAGIVTTDKPPLPVNRFPEVLRGHDKELLSIEEAVTWYHALLARPEALT